MRPECRYSMQNCRTKSRVGLSEVMYVLGGFGSLQSPVDVVEKYDPTTNQWSVIQVILTELIISVVENMLAVKRVQNVVQKGPSIVFRNNLVLLFCKFGLVTIESILHNKIQDKNFYRLNKLNTPTCQHEALSLF